MSIFIKDHMYYLERRKQGIAKATGAYINENTLKKFPTRAEIEIAQLRAMGEKYEWISIVKGISHMQITRAYNKVKKYFNAKKG